MHSSQHYHLTILAKTTTTAKQSTLRHAIIFAMKTIAIIAEYNPFHGGHAWQIQKAREQFGHDCAVMVAMSGCFTQRGEPTLLDKWARTSVALACGVDLVLELPFAYATASAETFAAGGVQLLQSTGLHAHLVFGSEIGLLQPLEQLAQLLGSEPEAYRIHLREQLDRGLSFAAARQQAAAAFLNQDALASLLKQSNNILAVEYLKAVQQLPQCRLTPFTLPRQGQTYTDDNWLNNAGKQASASAIRHLVFRFLAGSDSVTSETISLAGLIDQLTCQMPQPALAALLAILQDGPGPLTAEDCAPALFSRLRGISEAEIDQLPGMNEGLGRRLMAAARRPSIDTVHSSRLNQLLADTSTRRFPQTRINRALAALLAGLTADDLKSFKAAGGPQYIRVLGFSRKGRHLLKLMHRLAEKPVITKGSDFLEYSRQPLLTRMAELDCAATDIWFLHAGRTPGRDFDTPVIMR